MSRSAGGQHGTAAGRIALVTGATDGIGRATALGLARLGMRVVVVGRDRGRGEAVLADIAREGSGPAADLLLADLASLADVRRLAGEVLGRYQRLDVLINNAGVLLSRREETPDGLERMFAVNYLAPFLLTNLLRPLLERSAPARVINVTSLAQRSAKIDFEDLQAARGFRSMRVYGQSKLADLVFSYELARRLAGTGVTANVFEPGLVATSMPRRQRGVSGAVMRLLLPVMSSPERAARTAIHLASSPDVAATTGAFLSSKGRPATPSKVARDQDVAARLWRVSEELTGLVARSSAG
ncbi:MAG: SDR family NAD(P)-dependent oxidoreductase [Actinobacteria bacterium]|nr:SDR family NAD(P)-dependent oxidoreductase [Actinomycetota bacterium]MBI3687758.1 SDR family NAD(P)-dependent oxidoreductase [Actinomycetota bacterium]